MNHLIVPLHSAEATDPGRFGPKAANQAVLGQAGLPILDGCCLAADAYRHQVAALGLEAAARGAFASSDPVEARQCALQMKLALLEEPIQPAVLAPLLEAWRDLVARNGPPRGGPHVALTVVRSSALVEDRFGSSFAGQFESYLGLEHEAEVVTAVRACWAALWSTRALRYMATHDLDPADTAMAVLVQPLVRARAAGGGLSRTADGGMLVNATLGLGSSIAQGEVTPDRFELDRDGTLLHVAPGRKDHAVSCGHRRAPATEAVSAALAIEPCLNPVQVSEIAAILRRAEDVMGMAVEIEWALDEDRVTLLQARPLHLQPAQVPDEIWLQHPRLNGHPAGVGWGAGRAVVINCECELGRVAAGDVLVTRVAGPALGHVLPRVSGVVTERGGSTSHFASLARERGIPMVLGVADATRRIPDGAQVAVDGVAGIVRWISA
jgi:pyruvate,water dikinase